jgi:hypothetical protein
MKKALLLVFAFFLLNKIQAQTVFCPLGAEWHYLFNFLGFLPGNSINENIKYTGDTLEGSDNVKILTHTRFFLQCSPVVNKTLIKQKGDTVFFKNSRTLNGWQILYNFAALPGQSWTTSVLQNDSSVSTFTYSVDSVKQISVNGFSLKNLYVTKAGFSFFPAVQIQITERFGSS